MPLRVTRNDENGAYRDEGMVFHDAGGSCRVRGRFALGAFKPVAESDPDADTYPELLSPTVGEHVEQSVQLLGVYRQRASFGGASWTPYFLR